MTRIRTSSKTTYTPEAKKLLASLTPHAAMATLMAAQMLLRAEGGESSIPLSRLLTDEQRRAHQRAMRADRRRHRMLHGEA